MPCMRISTNKPYLKASFLKAVSVDGCVLCLSVLSAQLLVQNILNWKDCSARGRQMKGFTLSFWSLSRKPRVLDAKEGKPVKPY